MTRIALFAAATGLVAGCGQFGMPTSRSAAVEEPVVAAVQPAPTVIYEVHREAAAPAVVNNITNTTLAEPRSSGRSVVYVRDRKVYRSNRHYPHGIVRMVVRPVLRRILHPSPPRHRPPDRRHRMSPPPRPPQPPRHRPDPPRSRPAPKRERERPRGPGGRR